MYFRVVLACLALAGCSIPAGGTSEHAPARSGLTRPAKRQASAAAQAVSREAKAASQAKEASTPPAQTRGSASAAQEAGNEDARCRAEWARVHELPALPGTPKLDPARAEMLARAKGEPVVFMKPPTWHESKSAVVRGYRRALEKARFPWETLRQIRDRFQYAPKIGRQVLLRDGYLYAETADLGWALWDSVRLEHLFDEPELSIHRGSEHLLVKRNRDGRYVYANGLESGKPARLLLFDRVSILGDTQSAPLHRDVRSFAHELGFDRARVVHHTADRLLAELRYQDVWAKAVIAADGSRLSLICEMPKGDDVGALSRARESSRARARVLSVMRSAMLDMVSEELPFDEPKTEWGQQDGHLLNHWSKAYGQGEESFFFQGDRYSVFTPSGKPAPPQVCIDFVTHTLERASGTWWREKGAPPGRMRGGIDFDGLLEKSRRQVTTFLQFTKDHEELFEHELLSSKQRIPYVFKRQFYRHLAKNADRYAPGTIVVIRGFAPWDHFNVPHYHAFFVYESDPVTGMPLLLAGNAGKPRIQSWEPVMSRAPQRSIHYRIRPKMSWLAGVIADSGAERRGAPPLLAVF